MAYFYSASQRAFYCTEIVSVDVMPADKVAVSDEVYKSLMAAQNAGKLIRPGAGGAPGAVDQTGAVATGIVHELTAATADKLGHIRSARTSTLRLTERSLSISRRTLAIEGTALLKSPITA